MLFLLDSIKNSPFLFLKLARETRLEYHDYKIKVRAYKFEIIHCLSVEWVSDEAL